MYLLSYLLHYNLKILQYYLLCNSKTKQKNKKTKKQKNLCRICKGLITWSHLGSNQGPPDYEIDEQTLHIIAFSFKVTVLQCFIILKKYFCSIVFDHMTSFVVRMLYSLLNFKNIEMKASVKLILKKTILSNGTYPINLRITINRKSKFYKTPYDVLPKFWNDKTCELTSKYPNYLQANRILSSIKQDASKVLNVMIENQYEFSTESFDSLFRPVEIEKLNFIPFFEQKKKQFIEAGKISSSSSYQDTISALIRFNPEISSCSFTKINYSFLMSFEFYLRANGCNDGGIGVYMRNIRSVYNSAINSQVVSTETYPFKDYIISKLKSSKVKKALSKQDLQLLLDYNFLQNKEGMKVLYTYLFSFYCRGMNFTDIAELKWDDVDSSSFSYIRNKTLVKLNVKIPDNKYMSEILKYFKIYRPYQTDYIFPILEKDKNLYSKTELRDRKKSVLNYYGKLLNKISLQCGIKTKVTFYTARHTFATLALKKGLSTVMIKQGLGHQSIKTTEAYLEDFSTEELDLAFEDII